MEESLDQNRSVHLVLYSTQRQNSTVRKLSRLPAFPGEGAASALPVLYVCAQTSGVLNPNPMCAMYAVRKVRTLARAEYVRRTARFWKTRVLDYYARTCSTSCFNFICAVSLSPPPACSAPFASALFNYVFRPSADEYEGKYPISPVEVRTYFPEIRHQRRRRRQPRRAPPAAIAPRPARPPPPPPPSALPGRERPGPGRPA